MIAATLFSGIGAPEVSMPEWDWRWHAEIEKFPSAVLAHRHPQSVNLGDVNGDEFVERAAERGRPNVLVFGSPCQSFSVAGNRLGMDDPRGNLALVALGIARKLRPRWVVFENVPGLFSSYSGSDEAERRIREGAIGDRADCDEDSDFAALLRSFRECGYLGCYRVFDAQHSGVPQRRRRIFFVGHLGDWRPAAAVLLEPTSLRGDSPPRREAGERVAPTVEARANAGSAGWGTDFMSGGGLAVHESGHGFFEQGEVAQTIRKGDDGGGGAARESTLIVPPLNAGMGKRRGSGAHGDPMVVGAVSSKWSKRTGGPAGDECYNLVTAYRTTGNDGAYDIGDKVNAITGMTDKNEHVLMFKPSHFTRGKDGAPSDLAPALSSEADKGDQDAVVFQTRVARNGRGDASDLVPALNGADAGATSDMRPCVATEGVVRRLTPRECERLQGFEDDYTLIKFRGKLAADGPRYKALGNSMNVRDIGAVLRRIQQFEEETR